MKLFYKNLFTVHSFETTFQGYKLQRNFKRVITHDQWLDYNNQEKRNWKIISESVNVFFYRLKVNYLLSYFLKVLIILIKTQARIYEDCSGEAEGVNNFIRRNHLVSCFFVKYRSYYLINSRIMQVFPWLSCIFRVFQ